MKNIDIIKLSYKNSLIGLINFILLFVLSIILNYIYIWVINTFRVDSINPTSTLDIFIVLFFGIIILTPLFFAIGGTLAIIIGLTYKDIRNILSREAGNIYD